MIVMHIKLDNIFAFNNFGMKLSYPKKLVGSTIENEFLNERPNFRYKKLVVLMGANATGKTTLGKALMAIFNFIAKKNITIITESINDETKDATFLIDFVANTKVLYRVTTIIHPPKTETSYQEDDIQVQVISVPINKNDSYETCSSRLDAKKPIAQSYLKALESVENFGWLFAYPSIEDTLVSFKDYQDNRFQEILQIVLSTLDISIREVVKAKEIKDSFIIKLGNHELIIQDGKILNGDMLSSGTRSGIGIAMMLAAIITKRNGFYYCDEKFSFIHSDLEKEILAKMVEKLDTNEQLFFTTHNMDILDMSFPKHSFVFLKKKSVGDVCRIVCINADDFLKRNTDSLRRAVENDLFSTAPNVNLIDRL